MNRRDAIKKIGWVSTGLIFVPRLIRAQMVIQGPMKLPINPAGGTSGIYSLVGTPVTAATSGNNSVTTASRDTTGAALIVISCSRYAGTPTISDNKSNSYTGRTDHIDTTAAHNANRIYDCILPTVGAGHTWTVVVPSGTGYPSIVVYVFAKTGTTPQFDTQSGYSGNGGVGITTPQMGSATPAGDNELFVLGMASDHNISSVDSGFGNIKNDGNSGVNGGAAFFIQTTGAALAPIITLSGSTTDVSGSMCLYQ